ncbi:MAG: hypothetical protein KGY44_07765 [Halanaerobiales bacterium]|nr:hypothetical protein [Halanaerobiales bacterium]
MKEIIDERKIGEKLSVGVQSDKDEIGLFIASEDVSATCAFRIKEWKKFVKAIKDADKRI